MYMTDYVVCIPSYKRSTLCNEKTLATLHGNGIDPKRIYIYIVAEEQDVYVAALDKTRYNKLVVGKRGLAQQRQFIEQQWPTGKPIVFFDDDVQSIDLSMSPMFKTHTLDYFLRHAFAECVSRSSYIWGVYPVFNPFFRKGRAEISAPHELNYIVGAFYGIINRPTLKGIQLSLTRENGQKEDVERTIRYYINDGCVVRFNKVGFTTKYYGKEGGLGTFDARLAPMKAAARALATAYPAYGRITTRKNGMTEFTLIKRPKITENLKTRRHTNPRQQRTRKNRT
jgi:hypothetical protein